MKTQKFISIKDEYRQARDGYSKFLNLYCGYCGNHVMLYQKDGPGPLMRTYLDRIFAPENLVGLQNKTKVSDLMCSSCHRRLAVPGIFEEETRKAYFLLAYVIDKRIGPGEYPPKVSKIKAKYVPPAPLKKTKK
jgi:hypothetical protein